MTIFQSSSIMERTSKRMGKPRRSKGCTTCIQRKVKCDEKVPSCGQCLKGGRKCSGVASAIFMNMDSTTLATTSTFAPRDTVDEKPIEDKKLQDKKTIDLKIVTTKGTGELISPTSNSKIASPKKTNSTPAKRKRSHSSSDLTIERTSSERDPSPTQLDQNIWMLPPKVRNTQVLTHQFLSHFINFFARASTKDVIFNSWMSMLPSMLASTSIGLHPSTSRSIAAASMIYYGRRTNDKSLMMEAFRIYGAGLSSQRKVLQDILSTERTPSVEEVCTPLLMSFFEIACCTSRTAYFQHLFGAAKLLEKFGPEGCTEGVLFELFHTLRLQLNYASISVRCRSPFCTPGWLTLPFSKRPKTIIDHLVDTITLCTDLHSRCDILPSLPPLATSTIKERESITAQAQILKKRLDGFWRGDIRERAQMQGWVGDNFEGWRGFDGDEFEFEAKRMTMSSTSSDSDMTWTPGCNTSSPTSATISAYSVTYPPKSPVTSLPFPPSNVNANSSPCSPIHEPFSAAGPTARPLGFYSTARLLVLSVLHFANPTPQHPAPPLYESQMTAHCASILSAAELTGLEVGYAYLRLILPLYVVGWLSPHSGQRRRAKSLLGKWKGDGGGGGVEGICEVTLVGLGCVGEGGEVVIVHEDENEGASLGKGNGPRKDKIPRIWDWHDMAGQENRQFGYPYCDVPQSEHIDL